MMTDFRYFNIFFVFMMLIAAVCGCSKGAKNNLEHKAKAESSQNIAIDNKLKERLENFAAGPRVKGKFAFCVYDLTAGKPVYGHCENQAMSSASCMKLLTGVAGLHLLGCNYRFANSVFVRGKVSGNGVLMGDVSFKFGLDPQFNAPDLHGYVQALKSRGVKKVAGRVVVDLAIKKPVESERHWYPWDLSFSRYGMLYKGAPLVVRSIKAAMRNCGISVADSQVVLNGVPKGSRSIYTGYLPIGEVIKRMWKNSSNTQATALLYAIGNRMAPNGDPVQAGVGYLRGFLRNELRQGDKALTVHDGCGLCTQNRLSPHALVEILKYGYGNKDIYRVLRDNLSIAGVDGTLAREMQNAKIRGKVRAKTGTLSHPYGISSLAGYCEAGNGHLLAFAIMDCEMSVLDARVLQRRLAEAMVK